MKLTNEEITVLVATHTSYNSIMKSLGYSAKGGGVQTRLKKRVVELGLDTSHFGGKAHGTSINYTYTWDEILIENSPYQDTKHLKNRLLKAKMLVYKCSTCMLTEWQNKKIVLQLDHINGINNDNRLINLRLLCPNCHSQTSTFCRGQKKRDLWV